MKHEGLSHYNMSLTGDDAKSVIEAVNQGIDSHLEACNGPEDSYDHVERKTASGKVITTALSCNVSAKSLPVLLRRLFEDGDDNAMSLASGILSSLDIEFPS
jgi:hypothetical protein